MTISGPAVANLRSALRGQVLCPRDSGYDSTRRIFNAMEVVTHFATTFSSPYARILLQQMHGAAARVPPTATAFAHRHEQWDCEMLGQWEHPEDDERCIRWTREGYAAMEPLLERTVYVNALGGDEPERVASAYGANYDRLAAIKARYDPSNFFRANHNVAKGG